MTNNYFFNEYGYTSQNRWVGRDEQKEVLGQSTEDCIEFGEGYVKCENETEGNFPRYNENGVLVDSGYSPESFATSEQGEKADTAYQKPSTGIPATDLDSSVQTTLNQVGTNTTNIALLQEAYGDLTQSNIVVVADHTAVSNPQSNTIYREQGTTSYSDWMYYSGSWYKMAEYNNAIDDVPTLNSNNLVKSGGVYNEVSRLDQEVYDAFKDVSKDMNAVAVISGTISGNYEWASGTFNIPSGCTVKNISNVPVNLYVTKDASAEYNTLSAGGILVTTKSYTAIRGLTTTGNFKLLVYVDNDLSTKTEVTALGTEIRNLDASIIMGGGKDLKMTVTAYVDKTLPFIIPQGSHIVASMPSQELFGFYVNYGTESQKYYASNNAIVDVTKTLSDITTIRVVKSGTFVITFVKNDLYLPDLCVGTRNVQEDSITPSQLKGTHIKSLNLFNKDTCLNNYYVDKDSGNLYNNNNYSVSDYIAVEASTYYCTNAQTGQCAWYDEDKIYISGITQIFASTPVQSPLNAKYIRISAFNSNIDSLSFAKGQESIGVVPFYEKVRNENIIAGIDEESFNNLNTLKPITSRLWNGIVSDTADTMVNGEEIELTNYPKSLKFGDKITLYANVISWGDGITIGKGTTDYTASYAVITPTQLILKAYAAGTESTIETVSHGLTFDTYIKVVIDIVETKWKFIIQTLTGTFITEINNINSNGSPRITSNGATLSDVSLCCTNDSFAKPIWMFGDSYFGMVTQVRELYWLKQWGYLNTLVQGFGGQGSAGAFDDLQKCIAISKPKYIVWCLGMNDNGEVSTWQSYVSNIKTICETYGITLILATVPTPLDTTHYLHKDDISNWIRTSSGCRYIDVAKAVGSNAQGQWFGYGETYDYQSTDNVHPSVYGAKAIATQFLIDFPEIMQY